ncbi:MAG: lipocalin family protein [Ignavibacteriaceae bacterium]|jgi:apolipoprotein D and lipocalin family protein
MKVHIQTILTVIVMFYACSTITVVKAQDMNNTPVTVDSVDLTKYAGLWYEIAKIPNSFQKSCARNTTATYKLRDDGKIDVINKCIEKNGDINEAKGIAEVADIATNAKLEVSFVRILGIQLFWGDYWIIGLDKDYKYAVVGTPTRKYGWILSRTPGLSTRDMNTIYNLLRAQGYNPKDFVMTEQTEN